MPYPVASCRNRNFGSPFTPQSVTSATLRAWYDFDDYSTLWKDTAATSQASALDDIIRRFDPHPSTPSAPYFTSAAAGNSGLVKAVSGGVGRGLKLDGVDDSYVASSATYFDFMHKDPGGFTLLMNLAYTDTDSGARMCHFSTQNDNAEIGVLLEINEEAGAVGAFYGWVGPNVVLVFGDQGNNSHDQNLMPFVASWENGFTGDDLVVRLDGAQIATLNTTGSPSTSSSTHSATIGARADSLSQLLKATVRDLVIYEGRVSADEILLLEAWAATR